MFVILVKRVLYCLPVSSIRRCRGEVARRRTSSCMSDSCAADMRPVSGGRWRSPFGEWQRAILSTRMLTGRLALHTRTRFRQSLPNPTTACLLGERALRRSSFSFGYSSSPFSRTPHRHHGFPPPTRVSDTIRINDLTLAVKLLDGTQWPTPTLQPVKLSLSIAHDIRPSGDLDDLEHTLNYASLANTLAGSTNAGTFGSLEALTDCVFKQCFETYPQIQNLSIKATKPKALLRGKSVSLHVSRSKNVPSDVQESFSLEDIEFPVVIGVNPEERMVKQMVRMNLTLFGRASPAPVDYRLLAEQIHEVSPSPVLQLQGF